MEFLIKTIIGGIIIATVSSVSQKYPTIGAFVLGIPLASIVSFIFLHYAGVDVNTFKTVSIHTVWFVAVSLLFFPVFVGMISHYGFWMSLLCASAVAGMLMLVLYRFIT